MNYYHSPLTQDVNKVVNTNINEILRGEISAVETYDSLLEKIKNSSRHFILKTIREEHFASIRYWRDEALNQGKFPQLDSALWGDMVMLFVEASKSISTKTAIGMILKGEEHGLKNYQSMLDAQFLTVDQKKKIKETFIPNQKDHIGALNSILRQY